MIDVFLTTAAAAARLGVTRNTLYAYVSRGRLRALRKPGQRGSFFDPVDLDALARRARAPAERRPDLNVRSAVTLIERGRYWYRGHDPAGLAASCRFEGVAELLWTERDPALLPERPVGGGLCAHRTTITPGVPGCTRCRGRRPRQCGRSTTVAVGGAATSENSAPSGFQHFVQPQAWLCAVCEPMRTSTGSAQRHCRTPPAKPSWAGAMPASIAG